MLIALVSILIFCTYCPASNVLASCGQYFCKFICLLRKFCCCCWLLQSSVGGIDSHPLSWVGRIKLSLGTKDTLSIGPVDSHWSHVYINSVRFIYLFTYLGLLSLCFVIKVANENVLKLCVFTFGSKALILIIDEVFIYMISTSYLLGKVAYQVNGFVQDSLNTFL